MICDSCRNTENDSAICFGSSRHCAVYSFVLTFSSFIFVTSMIMTVYLTHIAHLHQTIVVLIVGSCLLFLLSFLSNMYSIFFCKPENIPAENGENSNRINRATGTSPENGLPFTAGGPPPDILGFSRAREHFTYRRTPPPPPYEVQMLEMSRMLLPGISRATVPPTREMEVIEEARNLIRRMYEEITRDGQQEVPPPRNEPSMQQMVQTPKTPVRQQAMMLANVSQPNLVVTTQQTAVKGIAGHGIPRVGIRSNQAIPQKVVPNSFPTRLDLDRVINNIEGCVAARPQTSPRIVDSLQVARKRNMINPLKDLQTRSEVNGQATRVVVDDNNAENNTYKQIEVVKSIPSRGLPPAEFRTNQASPQKVAPNSTSTQLGMDRFSINNQECIAVYPQPSPRMKDLLQAAHKRKLMSTPKGSPIITKTRTQAKHVVVDDKNAPNNIYEHIEAVSNIQSADSSQRACAEVKYYSLEREYGDASEHESSVCSAASEPCPGKRKRKFRNPTMKVHRQLSAATTRKFRNLGQSPETLLEAIATCFALTPDEWMAAWKLGQIGVPPDERARILGVRLHRDLYKCNN